MYAFVIDVFLILDFKKVRPYRDNVYLFEDNRFPPQVAFS